VWLEEDRLAVFSFLWRERERERERERRGRAYHRQPFPLAPSDYSAEF
jgi:hypothetical protein